MKKAIVIYIVLFLIAAIATFTGVFDGSSDNKTTTPKTATTTYNNMTNESKEKEAKTIVVSDSPKASNTCTIKGNISNKGEKVYHMPGQKYYNSTKINTAAGERWFCSESEAVAAGWRKSKI